MNINCFRRCFDLLIVLLVLIGPLSVRADAQVTDLDPFWVVLERDTELRCGDSPSWYAIANLKEGQFLRVNAQSFDWYRVEYPRGTRVWIDTRDARIIENGARIETTRNASPRAINAAVPTTDSSYRRVNMRSVVPPGTKFRYLGPIMNNQNQNDGYIVPAPEGAQGFVIAEATRRATDEEVERFLEEQEERREQDPDRTPPQTPEDDAPDQAEQPEAGEDPEEEAADPEQPAADADEQEAAPEEESGSEGEAEQTQDPGTVEMGDDESAVEAAEDSESLSPMDVVIQRSRRLDEAYAVVAQQKTAEAEIRPLIQEYRELITLAEPTPLAEEVSRYAQVRIELLNLRLELQRATDELAAIRAATGEAVESFGELDDALAGRRDYIVVGRLVPSAIYDGRRLPLMYRLQSVDGGSGRTLAYLTPNEDIAIDSMLNAIVGVAGAPRNQGNSGVRIIEPTVIDVLRPGTD